MMWDVSRNLGNSEAPSAGRVGSPGWRDPRLWIGVALVAASVVIGVRVLGSADDTVEVWAVRADLALGQQVTEEDLVARSIGFADDGDRDRYLAVGDELPEQATLNRSIGSGELLPAAALEEADGQLLDVPLSLPSAGVPPDLRPGTVIDVFITPPPGSGKKVDPAPALEDVVVTAAPKPDETFGATAERQVVVGVEEKDADGIAAVLAAAKDGRLAIVGDPTA